MQTYRSWVFEGKGVSRAHALQAALKAYTTWLTAQAGGGPGGEPEPTIWFDERSMLPVVERLPPDYEQYGATEWYCAIGVIATMRLPARALEAAHAESA